MYYNSNQIGKIYRLIFKYNFKIVGYKKKIHNIDIELMDADGLKRTYSLATDLAERADPRWQEVDKLFDDKKTMDALDLAEAIIKDYEN